MISNFDIFIDKKWDNFFFVFGAANIRKSTNTVLNDGANYLVERVSQKSSVGLKV